MKKEYRNFEELLKKNLSRKEEPAIFRLIKQLKKAKKRGFLTKKEFMMIATLKSNRPKQYYLSNSEEKINKITKKAFSTKFEKRRIDLLTTLKGVSIPVASAILTLVDPKNYGFIDIRAWQTMYQYGLVRTNPNGTNFNFKEWYSYLMKLRYYAKKFDASPRDIDRTLYDYDRKVREGPLYG